MTPSPESRHARLWRGRDHDADECLLCAGDRLAALVRRAFDKPQSVDRDDLLAALEAHERLRAE